MTYACWEGCISFVDLSLCFFFFFLFLTFSSFISFHVYSGPRCGLGELILPENEPGSSIMPVTLSLSLSLHAYIFGGMCILGFRNLNNFFFSFVSGEGEPYSM